MEMQKNIAIGGAVILIIAAAVFINANNQQKKGAAGIAGNINANTGTAGKYDAFAKCLTNKGVILFGAYWCPHCQDQKKMFGESIKYVNYVECAIGGSNKQTEACSAEGISGYPTWKFADGHKEATVLSLEELSKISGCSLQ